MQSLKTFVILWVVASTGIPAFAEDGGEPPALALDGLDPVVLVQGEEVAGREELAVTHGRFRYRFANRENLGLFESEPERFEIRMDGRCAAMPAVMGHPSRYAVYDEKIYIFGSDGCREDFLASPAGFIQGADQVRKVAILVFDGVELLDFAGPGEVFAAASGGYSFQVYTVAPTEKAITSQGFVTVQPEYSIASSPRPDVLVVPGGGVRSVLEDEDAMQWIREVAEDAEVVLSVCNGAFVLAAAGLLDGQAATTHHGSIAGLRRAAPQTTVYDDRRYVDNGKTVTAAGVSAGIDASLHLVSRLLSPEKARHVARYMEYAWEGGDTEGEGARFASSE